MGRAQRVARKLRALDPIADLRQRLFRGHLPAAFPKVRRITRDWWKHHGFAEQIATAGTAEVGKSVGIILMKQSAQPIAEARRAGIIVLGELVGEHLHSHDLPAFEALFRGGYLADPKMVEEFATRVLGRMLERDDIRATVIYELAQWRHAETRWQRYAMCLAFLELVPRTTKIPGLAEMILAICACVVWSIDEIDQRAVGWILRDLSRIEANRVEVFFLRYARFMSKACARTAVSAYAAARRSELLAYHKRATTL
jgi:hypothetical protein